MKGKFFKCDCGHGGLHVSYDMWGLELAHLVRDPYQRGWKHRIASAYAALRGQPYTDMVVLNKVQMSDLVDYLIAAQNETSDEKYAEQLEYIQRALFASGHCETAVDGILKWLNSSDCSQHAYDRLKNEL